jgi:hypothetical protein
MIKAEADNEKKDFEKSQENMGLGIGQKDEGKQGS